MSSKNVHHKTPYTDSVIEKYLKGELSAREMHDLERAALEDPFLADALEGFTSLARPNTPADHTPDPATLRQDLDELHQRLAIKATTSTTRGTIRPLNRRIAIAAVLILLLGIGFTFFYRSANKTTLNSPEANPPVANAQTPAPAPIASASDSSIMATPQSADQAPTPPPAAIASSETKQSPHRLAAQHHITRPPATSPATADAPPASTNIGANAEVTADRLKSLPRMTILPDTVAYASTLFKNYKSFNASPLTYTGKVLDPQDHPLAGAIVSVKDASNAMTITDQQGQFRLNLQPQDSIRQLTVMRPGYNQAYFALNSLTTANEAGNIIHLQPDEPNLDEVVVVGYGQKRKETLTGIPNYNEKNLDSLWLKATPVDGREAYLLYLTNAKRKLGLDSTITGTEIVSFDVDRNGMLSSFKIEQSLSPAHDAGVIRLINEGPAWRLLKGKKTRAIVSIHF